MANSEGSGPGTGGASTPLVIAGAVVAVAVIGYGAYRLGQPAAPETPTAPASSVTPAVPSAPSPAMPQASSQATAETEDGAEESTIAPGETEEAAAAKPDTSATAATETATAPEAPVILPAFDLVRVEPDGTAVIAGSSAPGARVSLLIDGAEVAEAEAGADGKFVVITNIPPSVTPRVVSLSALGADGTALLSKETAVIQAAPVEMAEAAPEPEPATPSAPDTQPPAIAEAPTVPDTQTPTAPAPKAPAEPATQATSPSETSEAGASQSPALALPEAPSGPADAPAEPPKAATTEPEQATPEQVVAQPDISGSSPAEPVEPAAQPLTAGPAGQTTEAPPAPAPAAAPPAPKTATPGETQVANTPAAEAPTVMLLDEEGVRVVQSPGRAPDVQDSVTIDSISYDDAGEVTLAGRGKAGANVRVYLDNRPVKTATIAEDGQWRTPLPQVDEGVYTLRIDELAETGEVSSRVETPFKREDPAQFAAALAQKEAEVPQNAAEPPVQAITVQPGNTLWGISRARYGEGVLYVRVFEANRDQIKNPNLIYPGQVFTLPEK